MTNVTYENAPLVEVIVEVRWRLVPVPSMPDAAVDPAFDRTLESWRAKVRQQGLAHEEYAQPPMIPRELIPHQVLIRQRPQPKEWPLVQLGPGVWTANAIGHSYQGWAVFRAFIKEGLDILFASFPHAPGVNVEGALLRYVNAFLPAHGTDRGVDFIRDDLGFSFGASSAVERLLNPAPGMTRGRIELTYALDANPAPRKKMSMSCGFGTHDGKPAIIQDNNVLQRLDSAATAPQVLAALDDAHNLLLKVFHEMLSPTLRERIGPERRVPAPGASS